MLLFWKGLAVGMGADETEGVLVVEGAIGKTPEEGGKLRFVEESVIYPLLDILKFVNQHNTLKMPCNLYLCP